MSQPPFTRNQYLQAIGIPMDSRGATFNSGSFLAGFSASLATTTSLDIGLETGDSQLVLSGFKLETNSGDLTTSIYGGSTFTGGVASVAYNTNKNSVKNPSISQLVDSPTVSVLGDLQIPPLSITGDNSARNSDDLLVGIPLILKPNEFYIFRITHNDAQTREVSILFSAFDNVITEPTFP